ncbi:hypothetical protein Ahy_B01g054878 isoform A [Arachis hypogaea]|uniref:Uncharacterized protein n=1 Tax=Arachis hypogaea TaxID=3818 RepID=A0A445AUG5_ARAHY|nr:hypothetical protein Ahy_B01g054878 isoform A [Arachis hypogaea]
MVLVARAISDPQLRPTLAPIPAKLVPIPNTIHFLQSQCIRTPKRNVFCRCVPSPSFSSLEDWDWNRWTRHFSQIEHAESFASLLQFQLEDAIEREDFREAARVKRAINEAAREDTVAEIMSQLKNAIDEERYHDASRLCRCSGSGLVQFNSSNYLASSLLTANVHKTVQYSSYKLEAMVWIGDGIGWWVGYTKDSDDPFGRIIHVSSGMGRFVGRSYSPRQLITGSPGTPIFEIYVVKDADSTYHMQVVYLRRAKGNSMSSPPSTVAKSPSKTEVENTSSVEMQEDKEKVEINDEKNRNIEGTTEEGIKSVINFLKEKIPGLKVKVMNVNVEEEGVKGHDSIKQFMQESSNKTSSSENPGEESNDLDKPDEISFKADSDVSEEKDLDMKLFIGGVVHNNDDTPAKDEYIRLPAEIEDMERDSFLLHVPRGNLDYQAREQKLPNSNMAAQGVPELMPSDVAKAFWASDKVSSKVSKSVREIVNLAINQAQKKRRLSEYTSFSRIPTSRGDLDPFDGLYVGAFGPYGTEVVQLNRKFGHWNDVDNEHNPSDVEFFEYVEAVKLTGDLNVPAGQVTFRAKIGRGNRNTNRGLYPNEIGVDASYKGQGRIADFGFRNPKWVDGELLMLNGKGFGPHTKGADIAFLYVVPEQSFIVLFNRLKLPE